MDENKNFSAPITEKKRKYSVWKIATIVLAILLIASVFTNGFRFGSVTGAAVSSTEAGQKTVNYINSIPGVSSSLTGINKEGNFYVATLSISGREVKVYVTLDGKLLFPTEPINLAETPVFETTDTTTETKPQEIPKTDKPEVRLFVMSQCPYGTIAETAMKPVADLLGDKMDFGLHYIATDNGDGTFTSLHGQNEVDGNINQLCVNKYYAAKLWTYLECVNKNYRDLAGTWEQCAKDNGIDVAKIKTCASGEGKDLLKENIALSEEESVSGSPTLIINGVTYSGGRTAEAYKTAICSAFNKAPEECSETLSSASSQASGSCN